MEGQGSGRLQDLEGCGHLQDEGMQKKGGLSRQTVPLTSPET